MRCQLVRADRARAYVSRSASRHPPYSAPTGSHVLVTADKPVLRSTHLSVAIAVHLDSLPTPPQVQRLVDAQLVQKLRHLGLALPALRHWCIGEFKFHHPPSP